VAEGVNHDDEAQQWPVCGPPWDIDMQFLARCARKDGPSVESTQFEFVSDHPRCGSEEQRMDIEVLESRPTIDKVRDACGCAAGTNIGAGRLRNCGIEGAL
jgi:hypothetical protein